MNIMWSPSLIANTKGARPDKNSLIWENNEDLSDFENKLTNFKIHETFLYLGMFFIKLHGIKQCLTDIERMALRKNLVLTTAV